jgi:hypothetical protein
MKISSGVFVPIPGLEMVFRYLGPQRLYPDGPDIRLSFHQPVNWAFNDLGSKSPFRNRLHVPQVVALKLLYSKNQLLGDAGLAVHENDVVWVCRK